MSHIASFVTDTCIAAIHRYHTPSHFVMASPHDPKPHRHRSENSYRVVFCEHPVGQPGYVREVVKCETEAEALDLVRYTLPNAREVAA